MKDDKILIVSQLYLRRSFYLLLSFFCATFARRDCHYGSPLIGLTMTQKRIRLEGVINHCYQRTVNGFLAFYTTIDCLVFFTIVCVAAARHKVKLVKICIMPEHFHLSVVFLRAEDLSSFMCQITRDYSAAFNKRCNRQGPLFQSPYGNAAKTDEKKIRTNLIYVDNNPVERMLTSVAEDYRWNFLAYANNRWPFSEPVIKRHASGAMKKAMSLVTARQKCGKPLSYSMLKSIFKALNYKERRQLADYAITTYSVIDYKESLRYFKSFQDMLLATHSTTGSEHDIKEEFHGRRDDVYAKISSLLQKNGFVKDVHEVVSLPIARKKELLRFLQGKTPATRRQLLCYLHLPPE